MKLLKPVLYFVISVMLYTGYAWFNHYPIVYSDTGTYIGSGFMPYSPHDRPFTYGLFLRVASFNGLSLWTVILIQGLLLSWLILECVIQFFPSRSSSSVWSNNYYKALLLNLWLVFISGVAFPVSQLMADIFTPIAALSCLLLVFGSNRGMKQMFLLALYFGAVATHNSHLMMFALLLLIVALAAKWGRLTFISRKNVYLTFLLTLLAILPMSKSMRESSHVFLMGAMCEHGILKTWLDENCQKHTYFICSYKDSLPEYAWQFVWMDYSPLNRQGWDASREEYRDIIKQTLTTPRYMWLHVKASMKATVAQLGLFDIGDGTGVFNAESNLGKVVQEYFPTQMPAYLNSRQNLGKYEFTHTLNRFYRKAIWLCALLVPVIWFAVRKKLQVRQHAVLATLLLAVLLNAWSCGTFANAIPRLGLKMIWFVPLVLGVLGMQLFDQKSDTVKNT